MRIGYNFESNQAPFIRRLLSIGCDVAVWLALASGAISPVGPEYGKILKHNGSVCQALKVLCAASDASREATVSNILFHTSMDTTQNQALRDFIGQYVEIRSQYGQSEGTDRGILQAYDYPFIRLRKDTGETFCFPVQNVRIVKLLKS